MNRLFLPPSENMSDSQAIEKLELDGWHSQGVDDSKYVLTRTVTDGHLVVSHDTV
jgi:hypothetical protein